jgi:DNA-binding FadR family transcriptional regulator
VAHRLGAAILAGEFKPGATLSGEIEAAAMLDVSRAAYREAVQVLIAKGLVESRPKAGTRVLPRERWNLLDPDVLGWAFEAGPDLAFIRNLFELRAIVEPAAAALAAQRRGPADLAQMRAALACMTRHTLANEAGRAADRDFHASILRATRNDALAALTSGIGAAVSWTTLLKQRGRPLPRNPVPDHRRVFKAIAAGNAEAAHAAMQTLVEQALEDTSLSLQSRATPPE